jgi:hypothetical protein
VTHVGLVYVTLEPKSRVRRARVVYHVTHQSLFINEVLALAFNRIKFDKVYV